MLRTLAITPARGGSKRLPGKNLMPLNGVPLICRSVRFALGTQLFARVIVSSDDAAILAAARAEGADDHGLRPAELASDTAATAQVLQYELDRSERRWGAFDLVALLQPTTPFRRVERWQAAMRIMQDDRSVPSVIGVSALETHPFQAFSMSADGGLTSLFPEMLSVRSQDLPVAVRANGSLYLIRSDELRRTGQIYYPRSCGVLCEAEDEGLDIDTAEDFARAEATVRRIETGADVSTRRP